MEDFHRKSMKPVAFGRLSVAFSFEGVLYINLVLKKSGVNHSIAHCSL